ncbi:MAG: hypothetical protein ABI386_13165 [Rhodanobacter sp.]
MAEGDLPAPPVIARRTLAADPKIFYTSDPLVYAYAMSGRWKECVARAESGQAATGDVPDFAAAICYAHVGNSQRTRQMLAQLEAAARTRYVDSSDIAAIHATLGDKDAALTALEQAYRDRSQLLLNFWFLPWFKSLHGEPRYAALYEKIYPGTKLPAVESSR